MGIEFGQLWTRRGVLGAGLLAGASLFTEVHSAEEAAGTGAECGSKEDKLLRIVSHNIYWGQGSSFRTDQPPDPRPEVLKGLAKMYLDFGAQIVSLQEVQSLEAARMMSEALGMEHFTYREGGGFKQYGGAVFSRWPVTALPLEHASPGRILIRVEVAVPDMSPLQIMNMHLPSGRQLGAAEGARKRLEDATTAAGYADLLIGDFNQHKAASHAAVMEEKGYSLLWPEDISGGDGNPLVNPDRVVDQGWIRKEFAKDVVEFTYIPVRDVRMKMASDDGKVEHLSDHPAMLLTLRWERK